MKYIHKFTYVTLAMVCVVPHVSFAAFDKIKNLLNDFKELLDLVIPITFALALLFFFYGLAQFIRSISDKTIEEGKNKMKWGIVALFVMVSIWGIIKYIGDAVGIETGIKSTQNQNSTTPFCNKWDADRQAYVACD